MTAEEIRKLVAEIRVSKTVMRDAAPLHDQLLAEIAAQLAEMNEREEIKEKIAELNKRASAYRGTSE